MKAMILALTTIALTATVSPRVDMYHGGNVYSVWAEPGLHLMMSDNGTPDDYDDDWVVDWETNRDIIITVLDK